MDLDTLRRRLELLLQGRFGPAVSVERIALLAGDASTRRYARLWLAGGPVPATAVAMVLADRAVAHSSEELGTVPATGELPFLNVQRYFARLGVAVPAVYIDAADEGLVVLEDVGDLCLRDAAERGSRDLVAGLFRRAVDQLLRIQLGGERAPDPGCIAFSQAFDERLFLWEFDHFLEWGIERRSGPLPVAERHELQRYFETLAARLGRERRYLSHRDFHAWNLFVQGGEIRVLDFQDALLAPAPYDLATLLGDRDTPRVVPPELEAELLAYYREAWRARGGPPWDADHLGEVYRLCALQKAFKVIGRFHYLDLAKGKPGYLRYLPPTLAQIGRLLEPSGRSGTVRAILARYFPELGEP